MLASRLPQVFWWYRPVPSGYRRLPVLKGGTIRVIPYELSPVRGSSAGFTSNMDHIRYVELWS